MEMGRTGAAGKPGACGALGKPGAALGMPGAEPGKPGAEKNWQDWLGREVKRSVTMGKPFICEIVEQFFRVLRDV